jgi:o-succinylbenzoate---CoA ligase
VTATDDRSGLHPVSGTAAQVFALLTEWEAADHPPPLVIETSGSTGRPKRVLLSRAAMRASVRATHERLGGPGQWVLNLPPTYVAGVQVLFRSVLAGTDPVELTHDVHDTVVEMTGDRKYLSLVPTQLERCLGNGYDTDALSRFDVVLVGGGPLRTQTRRDAEAAGIRVVQTYGMSETCGGCVYDGVPLDGVGLKIDAEDRVLLTGPVLFDGYEGDPDRTAEVLQDGWFRTDDQGLLDAGRLRITGRLDDVVISGGVKVPAVAVERMLAGHPSVQGVAVVGVPDQEWGERVVAVVETRDGAVTLEELRDLVTPRPWAPRRMLAVHALPVLANGKLDRLTVRRWAQDA